MAYDRSPPEMRRRTPDGFHAGTLWTLSENGTTSATGLPCLRRTSVSPCSTPVIKSEALLRESVKATVFIRCTSRCVHLNVHSDGHFVMIQHSITTAAASRAPGCGTRGRTLDDRQFARLPELNELLMKPGGQGLNGPCSPKKSTLRWR